MYEYAANSHVKLHTNATPRDDGYKTYITHFSLRFTSCLSYCIRILKPHISAFKISDSTRHCSSSPSSSTIKTTDLTHTFFFLYVYIMYSYIDIIVASRWSKVIPKVSEAAVQKATKTKNKKRSSNSRWLRRPTHTCTHCWRYVWTRFLVAHIGMVSWKRHRSCVASNVWKVL